MEIIDKLLALGSAGGSLLQQSFLRVLESPLLPSNRLYWIHLLSSSSIVLVIYVLVHRRKKLAGRDESLRVGGFLRFCFPRSVWSHPSAWLDVRYFFINMTFQGVILPLLGISFMASIALGTQSWIMGRYGTAPLWAWRDSTIAVVIGTLVVIMVVDFGSYVVHFLQHKVPFLWEFHKVHHSAPVIHPLSNFREHPVDNITYLWANGITNGFGIGLVLCLFDDQQLATALRVSLAAFIFNFCAYHLRHSHVWLAWPPGIGRILGSPANHQIHHSAEARHIDKNFGFVFALWDWVFGTLYLPREREAFRLGLSDGTESEYCSTLRLYFLPFIKIFQSITNRFRNVSG